MFHRQPGAQIGHAGLELGGDRSDPVSLPPPTPERRDWGQTLMCRGTGTVSQ